MKPLKKLIKIEVTRKKVLQFGMVCYAKFAKMSPDGTVNEELETPFRAKNILLRQQHLSSLTNHVNRAFYSVETNVQKFHAQGSGWVFFIIYSNQT